MHQKPRISPASRRGSLWIISLAAFVSHQTGCELNGLYGRFHDPGPAQQATAERVTSTEDSELEAAALLRVQELLADEGQPPEGLAIADQQGPAEKISRPVRLSSVFSAISTQARRFGGRFVVP